MTNPPMQQWWRNLASSLDGMGAAFFISQLISQHEPGMVLVGLALVAFGFATAIRLWIRRQSPATSAQ